MNRRNLLKTMVSGRKDCPGPDQTLLKG